MKTRLGQKLHAVRSSCNPERMGLSFEDRQKIKMARSDFRRVVVKKEIDPLRKISKSLSNNSARARMTSDQVEAAYRSHQDGLSIDEISAVLWRQHGFVSHAQCAKSLRMRFRSLGLLTVAA